MRDFDVRLLPVPGDQDYDDECDETCPDCGGPCAYDRDGRDYREYCLDKADCGHVGAWCDMMENPDDPRI
jgi:hypothetical protein